MAVDAVGSTTAGTGTNSSQGVFGNSQMDGQDFLKLMIEELLNQDPLDPMKNQDLLAQVSQIRNMETLSKLDQTMMKMSFQNSLAGAGALLGRWVSGVSAANQNVSGLVVKVNASSTNGVTLVTNLGDQIPISKVTEIQEVVYQ